MDRVVYLLGLAGSLALTSCSNDEKDNHETTASSRAPIPATATRTTSMNDRYSNQLEEFLDSVGHLPAQHLVDNATFLADSIFHNQQQLNQPILSADFHILRRAAKKGFIAVNTARRIFNNQGISYNCTTKSVLFEYKKGLIPVVYYPFDNRGFDEYALSIGEPGHCSTAWLYFF